MIERKFISQNFKEFQIKNFIKAQLGKVGLSEVKLQRISMGERIVIKATRPGLIVGRGGVTIQKLTRDLKAKFKLSNPQIEIEEIKNYNLDAAVIAEGIVSQLERFGSQRFKGIAYKTLTAIMASGALGVEILISGKIPSSRAKTWRFAEGYMKKCGDIAISGVDTVKQFADLKTGIVGVQVRILPPTVTLPDNITFDKREKDAALQAQAQEKEARKQERKAKAASKKETKADDAKEEKFAKKTAKKATKKKATTKKATKKKAEKQDAENKVPKADGVSDHETPNAVKGDEK